MRAREVIREIEVMRDGGLCSLEQAQQAIEIARYQARKWQGISVTAAAKRALGHSSPTDLDARLLAAELRRQVAIDHLNQAADQLDAACADLSALNGAGSDYRVIRSLALSVRDARRVLDAHGQFPSDERFVLDHTPKAPELKAGHGKGFGCGGES